MNNLESEIIRATKEFALNNDVRYDSMIESMVLNAMREYKIKLQQEFLINSSGFTLLAEVEPANGSNILTLTNRSRFIGARFEKFLGNQIFETDWDFDEDEYVIAWKYSNND